LQEIRDQTDLISELIKTNEDREKFYQE